MTKLKKLSFTALLGAIALTVFILEAQIPPIVPIPGVKPGLSNAVVLITIGFLDRKSAFAVLLIKIILGSLFGGSVSAMLFSLGGGLLAYAVMAMGFNFFSKNLLWALSALSAIAHNIGQLLVAAAVGGNIRIFYYLPILLVSGIVTGVFTGLVAAVILKRLRKERHF